MYKYSLVLALDSIKDLEANFNSHEVKMFKCPLQHPPVQCQHHHSQHVGSSPSPVPNPSPKSRSQIQVPNPGPKSKSQIQVPIPKSKVQRKGTGTGADTIILQATHPPTTTHNFSHVKFQSSDGKRPSMIFLDLS